MASRRVLSLRSLVSARRYQPSYYSSVTRHENDHREEKPTFLRQRSFSSSIISKHPRSCSHLSLCTTPFGVSICRSMSSSSGSDESGNLNDAAATPTDSVVENVVCHVPSEWPFHFDSVQRLIETVHSFTGMDWCASIILTTLLIRGVTIPLMIYHEREWSRTMMLLIHAKACKEIRDPDAFATRKREIEKMVKENDGVVSVSALLPCLHVPALICMGTTIHNMTGGWSPYLSTIKISLLNGFIFWISVEYDAIVGFEGARIAHRNLSRKMVIPVVFAGLLLSKEVHCYLMTCMLFSIAFMHEIGRPGVKTPLGIPEVPQYTLPFSVYGKITMTHMRNLKKIFKQ
uniref:Putative F-box/LRR-repeat protein n=1 Tax=Noccaea caerulescens TaxID=107243 RepID=A0A1J3H947_NOCCA